MADKLSPSLTTTGTDADAQLAALQAASDNSPFYAEYHLISLVSRMRLVVMQGRTTPDLDHIIKAHERTHPAFSNALKGFVEQAISEHKAAVKIDNQRELYQRLYTAEQMKTQALIEHNDI